MKKKKKFFPLARGAVRGRRQVLGKLSDIKQLDHILPPRRFKSFKPRTQLPFYTVGLRLFSKEEKNTNR